MTKRFRLTPQALKLQSMQWLVQTYMRDKANLDDETFGKPLERQRVAKRMGLIRKELERRGYQTEALDLSEAEVEEKIEELEETAIQ